MLNRDKTRAQAEQEAANTGPTFRAAAGCSSWEVIDSSAPMWHRLTDFELARIGLRRSDLAPMRKDEPRRCA